MLASRSLRSVGAVRGLTTVATKVGVVGLGLMGHGIAQVSAEKGFEVRSPRLTQ